MNKKRLLTLCECGILLAMAVSLSFISIWRAPMGGEVTLLSMLPILLVGAMHGYRAGLGTAFVYSLIQLAQALVAGNVFAYCYTPTAVVVCVLFDYIVPFGALGLSAFARSREDGHGVSRPRFIAAVCALASLRFVCHFITGIVIWGQWAPEGMGKLIYSLVYNGTFMLPELVLTVAGALLLTKSEHFMRLLRR